MRLIPKPEGRRERISAYRPYAPSDLVHPGVLDELPPG
jgi:hypothetical protein